MSVPSDINPNIKVFKWVKTNKTPHYSDDELDADEPLAPLPDEPEIVEGDEDMEQDDAAAPAPPAAELQVPIEETQDEGTSKGPSPQPQLSIPTEDNAQDSGEPAGGLQLEDSLKPDVNMGDLEGQEDEGGEDVVLGATMGGLGPDGLPLEGAHDLSQLDPGDAIGGPGAMDESGDPFAPVS